MEILGKMRGCLGTAALLLGLVTGCGGGGGATAGGSGGGGGAPVTSAPVNTAPANAAPVPAITLAGQVATGGADADVALAVGAEVTLDASGSIDPDGDVLTYRWTPVAKPAGSKVELSGSTPQLKFKPDVSGGYAATLRISDSKGASVDKQVTFAVSANGVPSVSLTLKTSYTGKSTTLATQRVTTGANIVLDSAPSRDPDGDAIVTTWELIARPDGSKAGLSMAGGTARFTADVAGMYQVRARGTDPMGAYSEIVYPLEAVNNAPQTVVLGTVTPVVANMGANTVQAAVGYTVALSSAGSQDPDGAGLTYAWTLVSQPAGSTAKLSAADGAFSQLAPDLLGDYVVKVLATSKAGVASTYQTTVAVRNSRPQAVIGTNTTPVAQANGPTLRLPVHTTVTLRGTASTDADGDALTYLWTLVGTPAGSNTVLSSTTTPTVQLTTDQSGSYQVRLRVTDPAGAWSDQLLRIDSGNTAPVAVIDKSRLSVLAGIAAQASGALSYDEDGDALQYSWAIDVRPAGSNAAIANPAAAQLSFVPDLAGTYVASVTVSDGKSSSIAYVTVKALAAVTSNVALPFVPREARYSRGIDRFVAIAADPDALYIVDPFTGTRRQVPLPLAARALNLSPDGKLAVVLHDGLLSLVDLQTATLLRSSRTNGDQTDAFVTNAGIAYVIGNNYSQWASVPVTVIDARTGLDLTPTLGNPRGMLYGSQRGIFVATKQTVFLMGGLSPADIEYFWLDAKGAVGGYGDSRYHGDYSMSTPLFLSGNEDLLFTSSATYFRTSSLQYAGKLALNGNLLSMSHSASADEAIAMTINYVWNASADAQYQYAASYRRFTGALLLPEGDVALPSIGGVQSYGVGIFHSANDNHVALVQTGSPNRYAPGVQYYLVTR